ncbi:Lrp/AsnC family transcriptional regulator [Novosphingobium arvoryzae]|uniref:ArsR family transcriptional regulator n=1 Tax=Novosphingobium arvoryzae TaxID=1256514 RepID=A0A918RNX0_9SPHN|nr:Lrp/AsnC family transcriptional regulator [Novosphingobium arvoryzae]GHA02700.1 ArsR family transcriptional regulator [Novosphingobium arvoryzae]
MNGANPQLDSIDWAILGVLQADASIPVHEVGDRVGLSSNACWRRIKRLEDAGVITGRVALVDPVKLGLATTVFVAIRTNRHDPEWIAAFSRGVAAVDEIVECHRMAGDVDYLLKLAVRDIAHYDRIYRKLIAAVPDLADVSSTFSMERMKATTALPRPS